MQWYPQPKQTIALIREDEEILYGGARGGGKTEAGLAWLTRWANHPKYRALVIRKNADDLRDWIDRARQMYSLAEFKGQPTEIHFPRGGIVRTGHLKDENAYGKYQGHEYQKMIIEELSQIPREKDYLKLVGSNRTSVEEIKPQVFCTTNPDEPGYEWIKERWKIPDMPDFESVYSRELDGKRLVFIPAKLEDNPHLMEADPNYLKYLESLKSVDYELYEAWRVGNWKGFGIEGAYYRQQMVDAEEGGRITQVPYDEMLEVDTWCDLGIRDSFAIGYFQSEGFQWRMIDYDEFEGESLGYAIQRMKEKGYSYGTHYAPHDIQVRELGTGHSRWETARSLGVEYEIVPKMDIQDGINAVRMRFRNLWIDETKCELFLKRIRRYHKIFDEKRGVFKNRPAHDVNSHAADMLRGWATTRTETGNFSQYKPGWITQFRPKWIGNPLKK